MALASTQRSCICRGKSKLGGSGSNPLPSLHGRTPKR